MSADLAVSGRWGDVLAILAMVVATYGCRASGLVLMSRVRLTPRIERALRALPGSIVVATVVPIAGDAGAPALLALAGTILIMSLLRLELVAILAGLGIVAGARALGF
jgi:uncharacterized membrane protein